MIGFLIELEIIKRIPFWFWFGLAILGFLLAIGVRDPRWLLLISGGLALLAHVTR